ncbi:Salicylate carboxymethyltransferase [Linum grandiflorum]
MKVDEVLHMNGGKGDTSYAANSMLQQKAITMTSQTTEEAITRLINITNPTNRLAIADLGCASGPNTLLAVSEIIKSFVRISRNLEQEPPEEFQVFLNDLHGNDFNNIFTSLPNFKTELMMQVDGLSSSMFFNGVPGSFYGRLFPAESLHFVHSSYSLQWLSQVPQGLEENRGNVCIGSSSPPSVFKAYYDQFQTDFSIFLKCRALEMVAGGQMVLTLLGRRTEDSSTRDTYFIWELLSIVLNQMAFEGLIDMQRLDSFNIPNYFPSRTEIKAEIEKEGSFTMNSIRVTGASWNPYEGEEPYLPEAMKDGGYNVAKYIRAVVEPLLVRQFGSTREVIDEVFDRYHVIVSKWMADVKTEHVYLSISLTKYN